jgi:hypothetical protein
VSARRAPGDHFSNISATYAAFRPRYPRALFEFVASIAPKRRLAWDCGAGSGQATVDLAEWFDGVVATDVSKEQLENAPDHSKVRRLAAPAEAAPLTDASVDLITVAQALHWFDHERFYAEVRRVGAPGAAIAVWAYAVPRMDGDVGRALHHLMFDVVGPFWPPERRYVESEYRTIPFPFERIESPALALEESWTRPQVVGYARSWSATARYVSAKGDDPVVAFERAIQDIWPDPAEPRRIVWPLILIAGRVHA